MQTILGSFLILSATALGAVPEPADQPVRSVEATTPKPAAVTIEQTAPVTVVYMEHTGPYWTVRAKLSEVIDYMRAHGISGTSYVRYGAIPTERRAAGLASEVGFISPGDHQPAAPFLSAGRDTEWVASMTIDSSGSIAPHYYRTLRDWVEVNGHTPIGPIIEIYLQGFGDRADGRSGYRVVLQMPIQAPSVEPKDTIPTLRVEAVTALPQSTGGDVAAVAAEQAATVPTTVSTPTTEKKESTEPTDGQPPSYADDGSKTMAELLDEGRADAIARRLMPEGRPIPDESDLWLGQVVFRISAAAKGIERTYPGEGASVQTLAEAIKARYRLASTENSGQALQQVVVRVDAQAGRLAKERRVILQNLDRLLARIALKAVDASEARAELAARLEQIAAVLESTRAATSPDK